MLKKVWRSPMYGAPRIRHAYISIGQDLISAVANVQSAVKSLITVQFNKTFFCFVGIHMQNNMNVTYARCGQYFISSVANFQVHHFHTFFALYYRKKDLYLYIYLFSLRHTHPYPYTHTYQIPIKRCMRGVCVAYAWRSICR